MSKIIVIAGLLLICMVRIAAAQITDTGTYEARITFTHPSGECTLSGDAHLTFNTVTKTYFDIDLSRSARIRRWGRAHIEGKHISSWTVSVTFPSTLDRGSDSYDFDGNWRQSDTNLHSGSTPVSGSSHSDTAGGLASEFEHYFWFGGTVSGSVTRDSPTGTYSGTITFTASCS